MNLDRVIAVRNSKTVYRDGDLCVKVFDSGYSKADVLNEAMNQARIEETELNIPKIIEVLKIEGKWAIVSEYIKGKTLAQLMKENPEQKDEYIELMVDLQIEVNSQKCPLLNKLRDRLDEQINKAEVSNAAKYDLYTRLNGMPKNAKLCHGDFEPANIIITEENEAYIIDWSQAAQGNPAADAARTYLLFWLEGDISGAEKYLDLFCEKTNVAKHYVQKWMPIVAASQSVKGNEKEREFLLSWVDVVDYE
ncbi:MAG: phosphotransferase family protein [Bacillota bacterium]|jgi:RIO-like serine/threonine protein kinase